MAALIEGRSLPRSATPSTATSGPHATWAYRRARRTAPPPDPSRRTRTRRVGTATLSGDPSLPRSLLSRQILTVNLLLPLPRPRPGPDHQPGRRRASSGGYLLSNEAPGGHGPLRGLLSALGTPSTFRHLDGLGLDAGWWVWEVGAGRGLRCSTTSRPGSGLPATCWPPISTSRGRPRWPSPTLRCSSTTSPTSRHRVGPVCAFVDVSERDPRPCYMVRKGPGAVRRSRTPTPPSSP